MQDAAAKQGRGRRIGCLVVVLVLLLAPVLSCLVFGATLQRTLVRSALTSTLKAEVGLLSADLIGGIALDQLRVAQPATDPTKPPAISAESVTIDYALFPEDGRYVNRLNAEDLRIALLRDADGTRNFAFLVDFLTAPASGMDPMMLMPRELTLAPVAIQASAPDWDLQLGGLTVTGALETEEHSSLKLSAPAVTGQWRLEGVVGESPLNGAVDLALDRQGGDLSVEGTLKLDELAAVDASAVLQLGETTTAFDIDVREAAFTQALWGRLLRDLAGVPLHFDSLDVSGAAFKGAVENDILHLDAASLRGEALGVVVGDDAQTYYQGDAVLALSGALGGAEDTFTAELELTPGGALTVEAAGPPDAFRAKVATGTWEIEAMRAALPEAYRESLDLWPALAAVQLDGDVARAKDVLTGSLKTTPQLQSEGGTAPEIQSEWRIELNSGDLMASTYTGMLLAQASGTARVEFSGTGANLGDAKVHLEQTPIGAWYRMWQGEALSDIDAILSGDIHAGPITNDDLPLSLKLDGTIAGLGSNALSVQASGGGRYGLASKALRDLNLNFGFGEIGNLSVKNAAFATDPRNVSGGLSADLDLDYAGAALGMRELHGTATLNARLGWDGKKVLLNNLKAVGDTLGYGDLFLPYGTESTLTGVLTYEPAAARATIAPLDVALMDGTSIRANTLGMTFGDKPVLEATAVNVETDLALLVAREYLAGADAEMTVALKDLQVAGGQPRAGVEAALAATTLILPNTLSVLRGVEAQLAFAYDGGMDGGGTVAVEELEAAGTTLHDLNSEVQCKGTTITLEGLRTKLFAGNVVATIAADLGSETLQATVKATGEQIDLAVFTEEFEPPQVELTGKVYGSVSAALTPTGITAMEVDLESTEDFSLNREIVEDLLKSQEGGAMSDRVMDKVLKKMLGDAPQRPFDRAALTLNLQDDGRVGGEARLESSDLNLTVAIAADPEAILAALRARQE